MKNIIIMAAVQPHTLAIGNKGQLLWHIPEDMKFFKEVTMGQQVVVGRKTWESIPNNLPGRDVFVITSRPELIEPADNVRVFKSVYEVLHHVNPIKPLIVIGGATIYEQFLPHASQMLITLVDRPVEEFDTQFPSYVEDKWVRSKSSVLTEAGDVVVHLLVREE